MSGDAWNAQSISGRFRQLDLPALPTHLGWVVDYHRNGLTLFVTNGPPAEPPVLISVSTLDGTSLHLCFNEPIDGASAANVANYRLSSGAPGAGIVSAIPRPDGQSVTLRLATSVTGTFTVRVLGVLDLDLPPRAADSTASATPLGFASTDIGTPGDPARQGSALNCGGADLELTASGSSADHFHFVYRWVCGDFDLQARMEFSDFRYNSLACLVARETLDSGSRGAFVGLQPDNGNNTLLGFGRREPDAMFTDWRTVRPQFLPGPREGYHHLRLRRQGDHFAGFFGRDGTNWNQFVGHTATWSRTLLVGLGLTAFDNGQLATARFSEITFTGGREPNLPCPPSEPPKLDAVLSADGASLTFAWPSSLASQVVLEATETLGPPNWQPVTATVQDDGTTKSVQIAIEPSTAGLFFRLRQGP